MEKSSNDGLNCSEDPLQLHISTELMDCFMKLAKSNTDKNLETCGVLAGSLRNQTFSITALIIPKQESTSNSCQTTNEEEIFEVQDKQSFSIGLDSYSSNPIVFHVIDRCSHTLLVSGYVAGIYRHCHGPKRHFQVARQS